MFGLWNSRVQPCGAKCCRSIWKQHHRALRTAVSLRLVAGSGTGRHHYEVLGIKPNATCAEIKEAFVKISKQIHPDTNPSDPANHDKFVTLNEAYSVLSKARSRWEYDHSLLTQIIQERTRSSVGSSTYRPDSQAHPQSAETSEEQMFWDETLWSMRDRSKDDSAYYPADSFYGIKGIPQLSNGVIVLGCLAVLTIGFLGTYARFKYSEEHTKKTQDKLHFKNVQDLENARSNARLHGTEKQLQLLQAQVEARKDGLATQLQQLSNR